MENGMTLSDIAAVTNNDGFGGGNSWAMIILFALIFGWGGNGFCRGQGDFGQYATAASQQEILFGQQFQNLDNKIDRIGNGIADLGYANQASMHNVQDVLGGAIVSEGRALSDKMCELKTAIHAEGEATRSLIQQNKIETLQQQVNKLQMDQALCGVVRYPSASTYYAGTNPFCNCNTGCGCNGNI